MVPEMETEEEEARGENAPLRSPSLLIPCLRRCRRRSFHFIGGRNKTQCTVYCALLGSKISSPLGERRPRKNTKRSFAFLGPWGKSERNFFDISLLSVGWIEARFVVRKTAVFRQQSLFSFPFRPICLPSLLPQYSSDRPFLLAVKVARSLSSSLSLIGVAASLPPRQSFSFSFFSSLSVCMTCPPPSLLGGSSSVPHSFLSFSTIFLSLSFLGEDDRALPSLRALGQQPKKERLLLLPCYFCAQLLRTYSSVPSLPSRRRQK